MKFIFCIFVSRSIQSMLRSNLGINFGLYVKILSWAQKNNVLHFFFLLLLRIQICNFILGLFWFFIIFILSYFFGLCTFIHTYISVDHICCICFLIHSSKISLVQFFFHHSQGISNHTEIKPPPIKNANIQFLDIYFFLQWRSFAGTHGEVHSNPINLAE